MELEKTLNTITQVLKDLTAQNSVRDKQITKLITEIAERGKESDERLRLTNEMIHRIITDNANTHKAYTKHVASLAEDRDSTRELCRKQQETIQSLHDQNVRLEAHFQELLRMMHQLALSKNGADNNINVNR